LFIRIATLAVHLGMHFVFGINSGAIGCANLPPALQ
jgi:hypothetical protein